MVSAITEVQSGLRPYQGAPGFRFVQHLFPGLRQGGISYYPFSSIKSGLTPSWTLAASNPVATPANITVAVAAGAALLDGQSATLASSANVTFTPEDIVQGKNFFRVFLNPTRVMQPITTGTPPTTRLNGDAVANGDMYLECADLPDHLEGRSFYRRTNGAWTLVDPSFEKPAVPVNAGQKRVWGNECHPKVTADNFTVNAIEAPIYLASNYPIFGYSPARSNMRQPASLEVATAQVYYVTLPYSLTVTVATAAATVVSPNKEEVDAIFASVAATTSLTIEGQAVSSYDAATGVITLAAAPSGGNGTRQVTLVPATPANVYLRIPSFSELLASENLTNP